MRDYREIYKDPTKVGLPAGAKLEAFDLELRKHNAVASQDHAYLALSAI